MDLLLIPRFVADECILVLRVYGFVCVHNGVTNICVFRFEMNNNESIETYIRYVYISLPQQRNHIIINIYMRVCLCQTLN